MRAKTRLLIIPSPLILGRTYKHLARKLSAAFEVEIAQLPGTGVIKGTSSVMSDNQYAEFIIENYNLENTLMLGHSNSGTIAAAVIQKSEVKPTGLILADTTGASSKSYIKTLMMRSLDGIWEFLFSSWAIFHLILNMLLHPFNFFYQIHLSVKNDTKNTFSSLNVPTLILWGKRDHTMPLHEARCLNKLIKDSKLYVSKTGSHDWILTNPKEAAMVIKEFGRFFS